MRRDDNVSTSSLGNEVVVRFERGHFKQLCEHLEKDPEVEQLAYLICKVERTVDGTLLLVQSIAIPEEGDLRSQSAGGVEPTKKFKSTVYYLAHQFGGVPVDVHTHCHAGKPGFSSIDDNYGNEDADYILKNFNAPLTHAMIVFGNDMSGHDAVIYDRYKKTYRTTTSMQILGRGSDIRPTLKDYHNEVDCPEFARQRLIPLWNQKLLGQQRVFIAGMGGNGAAIFQTCLAMGLGTEPEGWIAIADPDILEHSNLSRIPYAYRNHVGTPKVSVAVAYAEKKCPEARIFPYPCSVTEEAVLQRARASTVLIGAGDNDGLRKTLNEVSVRSLIPCVDLGCDVILGDREGMNTLQSAGGQARVVLPGQNACLVCCNGYNPSDAAFDLLNREGRARRAAAGYSLPEASPSVVNLNATVSQLGAAALLSIVYGEEFGQWDLACYDQIAGTVIAAKSKQNPDCPLCGPQGVLASGAERKSQSRKEIRCHEFQRLG